MLSTGTLPPAAVPMQAQRALKVKKFGAPATAQANTPPKRIVALKANFLPITSAEMDQNEAPMMRPT